MYTTYTKRVTVPFHHYYLFVLVHVISGHVMFYYPIIDSSTKAAFDYFPWLINTPTFYRGPVISSQATG